MSTFDTITCEYSLPEATEEMQNSNFQTRGFGNSMGNYTITEEGRLVFHKVRYETVPEEERPLYGKPEWDNPLGQLCGMLRAIPVADEDTEHHGVVRMYAMASNKEWFEYEIKFDDGEVVDVKRIYKEFGGK